MAKVKVSESVSQLVTRSPIELLWTAKKKTLGKNESKLGRTGENKKCDM